jgi:hypothetical protein
VMQSIADALGIPAADLLRHAGVTTPDAADSTTAASNESSPINERAIKTDPRLTQAQREALLSVYRNFLAEE